MALNQVQIDELNRAYSRLGTPQEGNQDKANIEYAKRVYGYSPNNTPQNTISREGAGYKIQTPNVSKTNFNLDDFQNKSSFLQVAKDILMKKQNVNRDIQGARQVYRTIGADTSPFGGQRDPGLMTQEGLFTDERFRQLSPNDQASVRASRTSAIQAATRGLTEEEAYREGRVEDVIDTFTKVYEEARLKKKDEREAEQDRLSGLKDIADLGGQVTAGDIYNDKSKAIDNRIGGSASWRNNNPLNIKWGSFAKNYEGAKEGSPATDGGTFATFSSVEQGYQAARDLLRSKNYKDLSLDQALKRWSNNGYGVNKLSTVVDQSFPWMAKKTGTMTDEELDQLVGAMIKLEGWKEGTYQNSQGQEIELTDAVKASLMASAGLSNQDVSGYSADDWIGLKNIIKEASYEDAFDFLTGNEELGIASFVDDMKAQGKTANDIGELAYAKLVQKYPMLDSTDINSILAQAGFQQTNPMGNKWKYIQ